MSTQSYWLMVAAAAGIAGGVGSRVAYDQFAPQQTLASQQPAIDQLHADLLGLRQDMTKQGSASADQAATLHNMWQVMAQAESDRQEQQAKTLAMRNDMRTEAESMRQQAIRLLGPH